MNCKRLILIVLSIFALCTTKNRSTKTSTEYLEIAKSEKSEYTKLTFIDSAINADSKSVEAYIAKGDVYRDNGKIDSAIYFYNLSLKLDSINSDGYAFRGLAYVLNGNEDAALRDIEKSFEIDSLNGVTLYVYAVYLEKEKRDFTKANQYYLKAIEADSTISDAYFYLARNLHDDGRTDSAYNTLKRIIGRSTIQPGFWGNLGLYAAELKKYDEAFAAFDSAAKIDSLGYAVYWNRPITFLEVGDTLSAIADFNRYLRFAPYEDDRKPAVREKIIELGGKPEY